LSFGCVACLWLYSGAAAELATSRKCEKYTNLPNLNLPAISIQKFGHLTGQLLISFLHLGAESATSLMIFENPLSFSQRFAITLRINSNLLLKSIMCDPD
jgi:hypothetical protein